MELEQLPGQLMLARDRIDHDPQYAGFDRFGQDLTRDAELRGMARAKMTKSLNTRFYGEDGSFIEGDITGFKIHIMTEANFLAKAEELGSAAVLS